MSFSLQKLRSPDATVTGIVSSILEPVEKFGKSSAALDSTMWRKIYPVVLRTLGTSAFNASFLQQACSRLHLNIHRDRDIYFRILCGLNQAYCKISPILLSLSREMKMTKKPTCHTATPKRGAPRKPWAGAPVALAEGRLCMCVCVCWWMVLWIFMGDVWYQLRFPFVGCSLFSETQTAGIIAHVLSVWHLWVWMIFTVQYRSICYTNSCLFVI